MDIPLRRPGKRRGITSESNKTSHAGRGSVQLSQDGPTDIASAVSPKSRTYPEMGASMSTMNLEFGCDMDQPVCAPCEGKKQIRISKSYCVKCKQYLCKRCSRRDHQGHAQLTGNTMPGIITVKSEPEGHSDACPEHGYTVDRYCCDDDCFCCRECVRNQHMQCTLQNLDEMTSGSDIEELKRSVLETVQRQMKSLVGKRSAWTKRKESMLKERQSLIDEVQNLCDEVVEGIQTIQRECVAEISETAQSGIRHADERLKQINKYIKQISDDMRLVGEPRLESKEKKLVNLKSVQHRARTQYHSVLTGTEDADESMQVYKSNLLKLECVQRTKSVHALVHSGSKASGMDVSSSSDTSSLPSAIHLSRHSVQMPEDAPVSEDTCIAAIEPLGDTRILIADEGNRRLKLFDVQFRPIHDISLSSPPRGISASTNQSCAVALPFEKSIQLCDIETDVIIERKKLFVGVECTDVFVLQQGVLVCCFDHSSSPLKLFDIDGNLLHVFSFPMNVCKRPNYIRMNTNTNLVYISDETEGVFVVDFHQREKGVWQYRNMELKCPQGITIDDEGTVYTVDYNSHFMHRLPMNANDDGVKVALVDIKRKGPQCVCFLPTTKEFLVAFDGQYQITRFKVIK